MTNPTTQISLSSVLKRTGKSIETVLSIVDIVDDGISIATNYMARVKSEQLKSSEHKARQFDAQLKLQQAQAVLDFKAGSYQIGNKARQLKALPEYEENNEAFNELLK